MRAKKYRYIIGIDCGVSTGFAVWDSSKKELIQLTTIKIHQAIAEVKAYLSLDEEVKVRVEDARKRKWFGKAGKEQLQGAGSIKRDAKIWEDFLTDLGVDFEMVAPMNNKTKLKADVFKKLSGYEGRCSVHGRDAAMLVIGC